MLTLNGERFASGRAKFLDHHPRFPEPTAKVFVKVLFADLAETWIAQVDTGAAYSILEFDAAKSLDLFGAAGQLTRVSTRFGLLSGKLVRLPMFLMADEGRSLDLEATFFVSEQWRG